MTKKNPHHVNRAKEAVLKARILGDKEQVITAVMSQVMDEWAGG